MLASNGSEGEEQFGGNADVEDEVGDDGDGECSMDLFDGDEEEVGNRRIGAAFRRLDILKM